MRIPFLAKQACRAWPGSIENRCRVSGSMAKNYEESNLAPIVLLDGTKPIQRDPTAGSLAEFPLRGQLRPILCERGSCPPSAEATVVAVHVLPSRSYRCFACYGYVFQVPLGKPS